MKFFSVVFFCISLLFSCSTSTKQNSDSTTNSTQIIGQIINPTDSIVLFMKNYDVVIDTLKLTKNNSFYKKYDDLEEDIYFIKHGLDYQYMYLAPNDSVSIRINMVDIDRSITYSGRGALKSEFFINSFNENKKITNDLKTKFDTKHSESSITKLTDSLIIKNLIKLSNFEEKSNVSNSKKYKKLMNFVLTTPIYTFKEYHLFKNKIRYSNNYNNHRDKIDINDRTLNKLQYMDLYIWYSIVNYSDEIGYTNAEEKHFFIYKNVVKHIKDTLKRDLILYNFALGNMFDGKSEYRISEKNLSYLKSFLSYSRFKKIERISTDRERNIPISALKKSDFKSRDPKNSIQLQFKFGTQVISFWNFNNYDFVHSYKKEISKLKRKYPNIDFITLNLNSSADSKITSKKENYAAEFFIRPNSKIFNFIDKQFDRTIIIKNGEIINQFIPFRDLKKTKKLLSE